MGFIHEASDHEGFRDHEQRSHFFRIRKVYVQGWEIAWLV